MFRKIKRRTRRLLEPVYGNLVGDLLLIHTPKCGGTYLRKKWKVSKRMGVRDVGHQSVRDVGLYKKTRVVGLVREPLDWYQSYFYFRTSSLNKLNASKANFPREHPISVFSKDGQCSFEEMIENMGSEEFLDRIIFSITPRPSWPREMTSLRL